MFSGQIVYNVMGHLTEETLHEAVSSHLLGKHARQGKLLRRNVVESDRKVVPNAEVRHK